MWMTRTADAGNNHNTADITSRKAGQTETEAAQSVKSSRYKAAGNNDVLEISQEAYQLQASSKSPSASSGKDSLRITKGGKNHTYKIHFTDSAQISRAIQRGYITVNGVRIDLSEETKEKLQAVDKQAQADREIAFAMEIAQHNAEVARQQGEAAGKAFEDQAKIMEIARRIASGGVVPPSDEQKLMEFSPEMYMMAKNLAAMAKEHEEYDSLFEEEEEGGGEQTESPIGKTTYEVQMGVSMEGTPEVTGVSEAVISLG